MKQMLLAMLAVLFLASCTSTENQQTSSRGSTAPPLHGQSGVQDDKSEEHTSELQSRPHLVCRLLLEKKKKHTKCTTSIPSSTAEWISMAATASAVPRR